MKEKDTMDAKPRLTKQGVKDLNHYGPKPTRAEAGVTAPASSEEVMTPPPSAEKKPDATVSVASST
jgi:hypothetical protein